MAEFDSRFFESTRGRIVLSLRNSAKTVNQLSAELRLTDNAIRAHLLALERDRLVEQSGTVRGYRKPHFLYTLTTGARRLFPKSYDSLLNRILGNLKRRLPAVFLTNVLDETGREIGSSREGDKAETLDDRVDEALEALGELGGAAKVVREGGHTTIMSSGCPFAEVVSEHPEVCKLAESMVAEIVGEPVEEHCDRTELPKCRFVIGPGNDASSNKI